MNSFCPGLEPGRQERRHGLGFKVVTLTDAAANRVKDIIGKAERPIVGVRVGVKNGGCAGMSYTMEYAESVNPLDEVVEDKGVTVLIDPKAVLFLLGTEMDFETDQDVVPVRLPQPQPDFGLRLRRIRRDHARRAGDALQRARLAMDAEAIREIFRRLGADPDPADVRRAGDLSGRADVRPGGRRRTLSQGR